MASVLSSLPAGRARAASEHSRLLVIGREGTMQLGNYLAQLQTGRGRRANVLLGFDGGHRVCLYQIGVNESSPSASMISDMDLLVGLNCSSLGFESRVKIDGWFVIDASATADMPLRKDIHIVVVPARSLAQKLLAEARDMFEALDYQELVGPVLFGAALSVSPEYPRTGELNRVFSRFHQSAVPLMVRAAYEGYDWVQDRQMRGKPLRVGTNE